MRSSEFARADDAYCHGAYAFGNALRQGLVDQANSPSTTGTGMSFSEDHAARMAQLKAMGLIGGSSATAVMGSGPAPVVIPDNINGNDLPADYVMQGPGTAQEIARGEVALKGIRNGAIYAENKAAADAVMKQLEPYVQMANAGFNMAVALSQVPAAQPQPAMSVVPCSLYKSAIPGPTVAFSNIAGSITECTT